MAWRYPPYRFGRSPARVQDEVGYGAGPGAAGEKHVSAKPLKGLGTGVLEIVSDHQGDTLPGGVYGSLGERVFVLHAFQKKSKRGIATPQADIDLIRQRLKLAVEIAGKE